MATIKISKYLSGAGVASRRKAEELIKQGLVFVNGEKMVNVAARIDPATDKVECGGKAVAPAGFVYYLLNKPLGYVSTTRDPHTEKPVIGLVPKAPKVWPVGRLDKDTSGLLVLTNDGALTQKLTHPRFGVKKEYEAVVNTPLSQNEIETVRRGVKLEDGFIKPDLFEPLGKNLYRIVIHSGKKRVVRRVFEKMRAPVAQLKRVRVGSLILGNLAPGKWRKLSAKELESLFRKHK